MSQFSRFLLSTTSRNSRTLSKRHCTFIGNTSSVESVSQVEIVAKRNHLFAHVFRRDISSSSYDKLVSNQGLNISFPTENVKLALEPYLYGCSIPTTGDRSHFIKAFNYWMKLPNDHCDTVDKLFNALMENELMCDDIQDGSEYRRGLPTAHKMYGYHQTHLSQKLVLFMVLKQLISLNNMKAIEIYADIFIQHYAGEYKEVFMRDNSICPTIEEYEEICTEKCQPVMDVVIKFMQVLSDCKTDFVPLSRCIGKYYQCFNDISNLSSQKFWDSQGFCTDISEGKYTLAIIHAINSDTQEGDLVASIIRQRPKDLPTRQFCLSLLEKLGSIDFAKRTVERFKKELKDEIERLGGNPILSEYINKISCMHYEEV